MTSAAECRTFGGTGTAPRRSQGGGEQPSLRMTPANAANFLRAHADAIEAAGADVTVALSVRTLDGTAPRSGADRMAGLRARRRLERHGSVTEDGSVATDPPGPPKQNGLPESANIRESNGETTDQSARAGACAREAGPDSDVTAPGARTSRKRARLTPRPENWAPGEAHRARAAELGVDVAFQADQFCSFHDSKGNLFVSWDRAFWTWLGNAREFSKGGSGGRPLRPTDIRQRTPVGSFDYSKVMGNGAPK